MPGTLPSDPDGTTNGPEGPLSMSRSANTVSGDRRSTCKLTPRRLGVLPDGVGPACECPPLCWVGGHSRREERGERDACSCGGLRGQVGARGAPRRCPVAGSRSAGRREGGRAARTGPSVRPSSVCQCIGWLSQGSGERRRERSNFTGAGTSARRRSGTRTPVAQRRAETVWVKVLPSTRPAQTSRGPISRSRPTGSMCCLQRCQA